MIHSLPAVYLLLITVIIFQYLTFQSVDRNQKKQPIHPAHRNAANIKRLDLALGFKQPQLPNRSKMQQRFGLYDDVMQVTPTLTKMNTSAYEPFFLTSASGHQALKLTGIITLDPLKTKAGSGVFTMVLKKRGTSEIVLTDHAPTLTDGVAVAGELWYTALFPLTGLPPMSVLGKSGTEGYLQVTGYDLYLSVDTTQVKSIGVSWFESLIL